MRKVLIAAAVVMMPLYAHAADTTVTQSHTSFDVDTATVKVGDTIIFSNKDDVTHNIQVLDSEGEVEDRGAQKPGESIKVPMAKAGQYKIRCTIHPKMKMVVTVQ